MAIVAARYVELALWLARVLLNDSLRGTFSNYLACCKLQLPPDLFELFKGKKSSEIKFGSFIERLALFIYFTLEVFF